MKKKSRSRTERSTGGWLMEYFSIVAYYHCKLYNARKGKKKKKKERNTKQSLMQNFSIIANYTVRKKEKKTYPSMNFKVCRTRIKSFATFLASNFVKPVFL